jgi:SAM-dependent methyltransferase
MRAAGNGKALISREFLPIGPSHELPTAPLIASSHASAAAGPRRINRIVRATCGQMPEVFQPSRNETGSTRRVALRFASAAALLVLFVGRAPAGQARVPYVPSPQEVVERMLELAQVTKDDVVYDLGSGDGRIPITAAKKYGARGVGLDINPDRIKESWANAKAAGVESLVDFREQDVLTADISGATVVTLYLLASFNAQLRPILTRQLHPGTRIVSHAFSMGPTWPADKVDRFTTALGDEITIYLWKADGTIRP